MRIEFLFWEAIASMSDVTTSTGGNGRSAEAADGEEPPDLATLIARGDLEGLDAALAAGADPNRGDRWGTRPLTQAVVRGEMPLVECLLRHGARADEADESGNVALMQACARGHIEIARALLAAGADPKASNRWGFGPGDWAAWPENARDMQALLREHGG